MIVREELLQSRAREFAARAHGEQRYGIQPYLFHLEAVARLVELSGASSVAVSGNRIALGGSDGLVRVYEFDAGDGL